MLRLKRSFVNFLFLKTSEPDKLVLCKVCEPRLNDRPHAILWLLVKSAIVTNATHLKFNSF